MLDLLNLLEVILYMQSSGKRCQGSTGPENADTVTQATNGAQTGAVDPGRVTLRVLLISNWSTCTKADLGDICRMFNLETWDNTDDFRSDATGFFE